MICFFKYLTFLVLLFSQFSIFAGNSVRICTEQSPPFVEANRDTGEVKGIDIDVFTYIFNKLGVEYFIEQMPWARCELSLEAGVVDIGIKVSKNPDREKFLFYPENAVWETVFVLFTNNLTKRKYKIKSYDDVKAHKLIVGVIHENSYNSDFWKAFPWVDKPNQLYHPLIEPSLNVESNMKKLAGNRIQLYPQDKNIGIYTAKKLELKNITYYDTVLFKKLYYNTFAKNSKFSHEKYGDIIALMKAYDIELKNLKSSKKYKQFFDKYLK
ncbi:transporter substrate-binding domain-containing protein [Pigmentibacter sp. JX0631]|uniref:substrate-binding periplasmic protein n=1 Tax=Pigmentibacter sp. JX0631 TaxID=2976982 RepID=UPI0024685573|nr:transporter substrate-binding domain-containing protein [Pigmentibacter sp. JX0631]WGL59575.1 transporter substrate-binding domain-containing protein [Pigmentibacter sp. JX0631]